MNRKKKNVIGYSIGVIVTIGICLAMYYISVWIGVTYIVGSFAYLLVRWYLGRRSRKFDGKTRKFDGKTYHLDYTVGPGYFEDGRKRAKKLREQGKSVRVTKSHCKGFGIYLAVWAR